MSDVASIRSERRLVVVMACFACAFLLIVARLVQLQVVNAASLAEQVEKSRIVSRIVPARRGDLFDRHGRPLAISVNRYDVTVLPSVFRETSRIDALHDVALAWFPHLVPHASLAAHESRARRVEARIERFFAIHASRREIVAALWRSAPSDLDFEKSRLRDRLSPAVFPANELVLPPSRLARRMLDCLVLLADDAAVSSRREVAARLETSATVREALGVDEETCLEGIDAEFRELEWIAERLFPEDSGDFWVRLFSRETQDLARLARRVEIDVDDQIALEHLGTFDLQHLADGDIDRLASELQVPDTDARRLELAVEELAARVEETRDGEAAAALDVVDSILEGRPVKGLEPYERTSLAVHLELWVEADGVIKRAFARRIRERDDFVRTDYLTIEKEWARRLQYKAMVPYDMRRSATFEVARAIWAPFGLRRLGFGVRAGWGREYWRDEDGVAALLIGRVNRGGVPLGGLELELSRGRQGASGPIVGTPGKELRRREIDGGLSPLPSPRAPRAGLDVTLTLDRELQARVEEILIEMIDSAPAAPGMMKGGAACVIDVATGDVVALATVPRLSGEDYLDEFMAVDRRSRKKRALQRARKDGLISKDELAVHWQQLGSDAFGPSIVDKASEAGYHAYHPPGSVLKPFVGAGFLQDGIFSPGETLHCRKRGVVDFKLALELSSNDYFWEGGRRAGKDAVVHWLEAFGMYRPVKYLDRPSGCALRRRNLAGDRVKNVVIGQGNVTTAPLEIAAMMANLARHGRVLTPRIVLAVDGIEQPVERGPDAGVDDRFFRDLVFEPMRHVGEKYAGELGRRVGLAGKTGTAELKGDGVYGELHNAWFAGFAPVTDPRFAVAVLWERMPHMGKASAPWAARIIEACEEIIR